MSKLVVNRATERKWLDPSNSCIGAPTTDVAQDWPAAWDWRLLVAYLVAGVLTLYYL
ncbi:MAG: hypothetical protein H6821_01320 [Planctomycetaceae bacterium]|nr:hypothetical protein [Planctomycetaceae bacterium]HRX80357.1 hypothetical protein [Pirellulaceae bacterium]